MEEELTVDVQQLRYFVSVSELGGFAKASDVLDVPQPTLSRQVRNLELSIGTSLFHRHGRGVALTDAGAHFLSRAQEILRTLDRTLSELRKGDARLRGHIVCGVTPTVGRMMIPEFVRSFNAKLPLARLSMLNLLSSQLHDQLRASRIDFAIHHSPPTTSNAAMTQCLGTQDLYLVGRYPVGPDARVVEVKRLDGVRLIMPSSPHVTRQPLEAAAARQNIALQIDIEVDAVDSLFDLVNSGYAHTVSTRIGLATDWARPSLVAQRLVNPALTTHLFFSATADSASPLQRVSRELALIAFRSTCGHLVNPPHPENE
ncbi:LysR family transcriptional regulator [Paraburkholderia phenoliruptrix]|uniref:LysR family transcriptional regulator n=1 Tax=Paraburkholderia phenoliruptrix TaxID=252970 RepID=UPI001C6EDEE5|nr:LysR family transcriptional regulator [Paraburkholderia phenoliruptrix]MBW9105066.1 LysR family transcriptional regulator [Paraburkholderia phenoliruptrix]MBW9129712.1 LysR family transcriptional regulator [Paraburkholderia ginsengiterrae]